MSGMLNGQGMGGIDPAQLAQLLGQAKSDPFAQPMPGEGLMGPGSFPQQPQMQGAPGQAQEMQPSENGPNAFPGLPNLPENFEGFGFGSTAPELNMGNPLRQQMIQQLMQMLPQLGGGF